MADYDNTQMPNGRIRTTTGSVSRCFSCVPTSIGDQRLPRKVTIVLEVSMKSPILAESLLASMVLITPPQLSSMDD